MSERIAVIGGGVMGGAIIKAIREAGARDVVVAEPRAERAAELRDQYQAEPVDTMTAAAAGIVIIAVKPQDVPALLGVIADAVQPGAVVASLAAGVRIATIADALADGVHVIRVMPNTPVLVGKGVFGLSAAPSVPAEAIERVSGLLSSAGTVVTVDESQQDALTAVSGSGPAYVFYLAEQMIAAGIEGGLAPDVARDLAVGTIEGAAALMASNDTDPADLRRQVTSPNGTTAAAIAAFDRAGVDAALRSGVAAAAKRSAELSGPGRGSA